MSACIVEGEILFMIDKNLAVTGKVQVTYEWSHKELAGAKLDFSKANPKPYNFSVAALVGKHIHCVCEDTGENLFFVLRFDILKL